MEQTPYYKLLRYVLGRNLGVIPANTKQKYNICTTSAQHLRRWPNIVRVLYKYVVFAWINTNAKIDYLT